MYQKKELSFVFLGYTIKHMLSVEHGHEWLWLYSLQTLKHSTLEM